MAPIAIVFGVLLALLSGGLFASAEKFSPTIFIPAGFGVALIVLGILARNEKLRMHAMHVAALLGLIGFAFPAYRVVSARIINQNYSPLSNLAETGQIIMSLTCFIFLALCVKSFIDVRKARKQKEAEGPTAPPIA